MPSETKMTEEPIAWIKRSSMELCLTSECSCVVYSVKQMYLDGDECVPLYSLDQVEALLDELRSTVSVLQGRLNEVTEERDELKQIRDRLAATEDRLTETVIRRNAWIKQLETACDVREKDRDLLQTALEDAAISLETIAARRGFGSHKEFVASVRPYAANRAAVARLSLPEAMQTAQQDGEDRE